MSPSKASIAKWEKRRRRGPVVFALTYGAAGLALFALMLASGAFMLGGVDSSITRHIWVIVAAFIVGGTLTGTVYWVIMQRAYDRSVDA